MISQRIESKLSNGSMIRKMFEEGHRLKKLYGAENVFDFSIGNPDLEPPQEVIHAIQEIALNSPPKLHGYMSNNGFLETRLAICQKLAMQSPTVQVPPENICLTVGAAGGLNATFRSILDPEDEIILLAPLFMEYLAYLDNYFAKPIIVDTIPGSFLPDLEKIKAAITPKTKAIVINSPNNPTGVVYPGSILTALNELLLSYPQVIHVISDEPYIELAYDQQIVPSSLDYFQNLIICYSWSKSLSLAGERIGFTAVSPNHQDKDLLPSAITFCNRTLGSVNAPAFFQKVIEKSIHSKVDIATYQARRDILYHIVTQAGFECKKPQGAFYLFPKSPIADDLEFCNICSQHNLLIVPGSAFAYPGYFRLAFCVGEETIRNSAKAFQAIGKLYGLTPKNI